MLAANGGVGAGLEMETADRECISHGVVKYLILDLRGRSRKREKMGVSGMIVRCVVGSGIRINEKLRY